MTTKHFDAFGQSQPKPSLLKLPMVTLDDHAIDDLSFDDLVLKCRKLSQSNAALRHEYDSMVREKSAALGVLRQQLAAMAQQELMEEASHAAASSSSVQEEVSNLKAVVEFLQEEQGLTKAALRESELQVFKCTQEAKDVAAKLAASKDSFLVYEHSLSDLQAKFLKEQDTCARMRASLQEAEEKQERSDVRSAELALQLHRCISENESRVDVLQQLNSKLESQSQAQLAELQRLQAASADCAEALAVEREAHRVLRDKHDATERAVAVLKEEKQLLQDKCGSLETSFREQLSKQQRSEQENNEMAELMVQSNLEHSSAHLRLLEEARADKDRHVELEGRFNGVVSRNHALSARVRELEASQIAASHYERSLLQIKTDFQQRLRSSKLFASGYVSNCVESLYLAVAGVFFWKWRFATGGSNYTSAKTDAQRRDTVQLSTPSHPRSAMVLTLTRQAEANEFDSRVVVDGLDSNVNVSANRVAPPQRILRFHGNMMEPFALPDVLHRLHEVCAELTSISQDLQSHAADLKSLATSAATALNELPSGQYEQWPAAVFQRVCTAYVSAISHCEARVIDMKTPLATVAHHLAEALDMLVDSNRLDSSYITSLRVISSQVRHLSDTSLEIDHSVRDTEPTSIQLRELLDAALPKQASSLSRSQQRLHSSLLKIFACRSSMNEVLGRVLSCRHRVTACAEATAVCYNDLQHEASTGR